MEFSRLIGKTLDEGMKILQKEFDFLDVFVSDYTMPEDFSKKQIPLRKANVRRIVRCNYNKKHTKLEILVVAFNEIPI